MNSVYLLANVVAAVLLVVSVVPRVQGRTQLFQLSLIETDLCLQIQESKGVFVSCTTKNGNQASNTVFLLSTDSHRNQKIQLFGTGKCLDKINYNSTTSNLCYSECDNLRGINWKINTLDGSVSEDLGRNCIFKDFSGHALLHSCFDGFEKFKIHFLGDHFQLQSKKHEDCLAGDKFMNCALSPAYFTTGFPGEYSIHVFENPDKCLVRDSCNSDPSSIHLDDCLQCGAADWSIAELKLKVEDDGMSNCIYRDTNNNTIFRPCSDDFEELNIIIIPNSYGHDILKRDESPLYPDPNSAKYLTGNLTNGLLGIKLFKYFGRRGLPTMELEFVHTNFLISVQNLPYIITHIHTSIPYSNSSSIFNIVPRITANFSLITQINIRYGSTDGTTNYSGLISYYAKNPHGVPVRDYTQATINQLNQSLEMYSSKYPNYYEQFYNNGARGVQRFLDYLYSETMERRLYWTTVSSNDTRTTVSSNDTQCKTLSFVLIISSVIFSHVTSYILV